MLTCTLEQKQTHLVCTSKKNKVFIQPDCIRDGWKSDLLWWDKDILLPISICDIISSLVKDDRLSFVSWRTICWIWAAVECQNRASPTFKQFRFTHKLCGTGLFSFKMYVSLQKLIFSLIIHLKYTCTWPVSKTKNHTKCIVECLAKSLVLKSTSFAKLSALLSDHFPLPPFTSILERVCLQRTAM